MFTKLNRVLLASGLAIGVSTLLGPAAFAGEGGVAGSASYVATGATFVNSVSTAAAVGQNGAAAWTFNDGANTSAGAFGSSGAITITGFTSPTGTITSVADVSGADNTNATTIASAPQLQLGLAPTNVLVQYP